MARYDVIIIGAGLGGLTAAAILSQAGRKVLVIERGNSVGGAASSYKVGDLFVEGSLHETSDPHHPGDPKHDVLTRAGVFDAVKWAPTAALYEVRGGPFDKPFVLPDDFAGAEAALTGRFPDARAAIVTLLGEMRRIVAGASGDESLSLADKLDDVFGSDERLKCALAANLAYYHDDPQTLSWVQFARAQGRYLESGARYVQGGSQRLSSALARAVKKAGSDAVLRRVVTGVGLDAHGRAASVTHSARDGGDPRTVECARIVSNAAPQIFAEMLPARAATALRDACSQQQPSISLFALTLGLSRPPREFGFTSYSTQLLPASMNALSEYAGGTRLMADEPSGDMPPMSIVDYAAIESGIPAPPYVLSIFGPDHLSNWDGPDMDAYRAKRGRWQDAIVRYLDGHFPGIAGAVIASSFNTALSVRQYLNAPAGAVYGFAPTPGAPPRSPRTAIPGVYLASAYAGDGGYTGVIQAAGLCADMILNDA